MPIETEIPELSSWLLPSLGVWAIALAGLAVGLFVLGWIWALLHAGVVANPGLFGSQTRRYLGRTWAASADLLLISPRRVAALAWLGVKEAIRRRVIIVFVVFLGILLMAGWFLDPASDNPAKLYLNFVMGTSDYLILLLMLLVTVFSLPNDIQKKTIYTVLTKPVRPSEIILGRILGFTVVGTVLVAGMGLISYAFVVRGLAHTHQIDAATLRPLGDPVPQPDGSTKTLQQGWTTKAHGHRHRVFIDLQGRARLDMEQGHTHVAKAEPGVEGGFVLGGPEGLLTARIPKYGRLVFRNRQGFDEVKGISVGDEWTYRSYIEGGSEAAAIWTFSGMRESDFPGDTIPVEMNIGVFRTHKGDMQRGILGSLLVRNPDNGVTVELEVFESKEFSILQLQIPKKIERFASARFVQRRTRAADGAIVFSPQQPAEIDPGRQKEFDLFRDLVTPDGRLEVWLQCLEGGQYFGMAKPDLYLRVGDGTFFMNVMKGYAGTWCQMVMVIAFGVMLSTFLSAPVAMAATLGVLIGGLAHTFLTQVAVGQIFEGVETPYQAGPIESFVRLVTQTGVMEEMPETIAYQVMRAVDVGFRLWLESMSYAIPPLSQMSFVQFVMNGYNVSGELLLIDLLRVLGYCFPVFILGHFFLKSREVAA